MPSVLWHCWFGIKKGIQPLNKRPQNGLGHRPMTLNLDRVKVISACTIHIGLPVYHWVSDTLTGSTTSIPDHKTLSLWKFCNIDIPQSLKSRDSIPRRKFKHRAPTSCRLGPMLLSSTISFEPHVKMVEEIDLEKCNFWMFRSSMALTLTLDRVKVTSYWSTYQN